MNTGPTVVIHQPEYFPWLGFLDKALHADVFVLLDNVQFDRSSQQHRAKIIGANGPLWLTIPFVHRFPRRIDEAAFAHVRWPAKHWKSIQASYGRAPGFRDAAPQLEAYFTKPRRSLVEASLDAVDLLFEAFGVRPPRVVRASELAARGEKGELVVAICRELDARRYLSGRSGAGYLERDALARSGVELVVQRFAMPAYPRQREIAGDEARGISALDAWLNLGAAARRLFRREERISA